MLVLLLNLVSGIELYPYEIVRLAIEFTASILVVSSTLFSPGQLSPGPGVICDEGLVQNVSVIGTMGINIEVFN